MIDLETVIFGAIIGILAQFIDGALGMAYGVTSNSVLLGLGYSPAVASASVHTSEVFTTLISGSSHFKLGNVNKALVKRLILSGVAFGALGAFVCTEVSGKILKPLIAVYLMIMGIMILIRIVKPIRINISEKRVPLVGAAAAFFDAIGGGGWGPISTSTLLAGGHNPRLTIGSVNFTEFFVTVAEAATFFLILGSFQTSLVIGLLIGGMMIAPLAAYSTKKLPHRVLMLIVGLLIIGLSIRTIFMAF